MVEMAETLKWVLVAVGGQRGCDCLPDCCQEVWLVVQTHCPVDFVGGEGGWEKGWLRENAMLWCRMGPVRTRPAHHRRPGHTSNDPTRSLQHTLLLTTFLYGRSTGARYDQFYDDTMVVPGAGLLQEENCV
jgi:hypothetical protein